MSILTRQEGDRTHSSLETGCQSKHMLHGGQSMRDKQGGKMDSEMQGMIRETNKRAGRQTRGMCGLQG